jgi:hypothetical protein
MQSHILTMQWCAGDGTGRNSRPVTNTVGNFSCRCCWQCNNERLLLHSRNHRSKLHVTAAKSPGPPGKCCSSSLLDLTCCFSSCVLLWLNRLTVLSRRGSYFLVVLACEHSSGIGMQWGRSQELAESGSIVLRQYRLGCLGSNIWAEFELVFVQHSLDYSPLMHKPCWSLTH